MTYSFEKCIEKLENELKSMYVELDSVNAELKDLNEKFSDYHENAQRKIGKLKDNNLKAQNQFYQIVHEKDLIVEKLQKEASIKLNLFVMTNRDYPCNKSIFEYKRNKKHKIVFLLFRMNIDGLFPVVDSHTGNVKGLLIVQDLSWSKARKLL